MQTVKLLNNYSCLNYYITIVIIVEMEPCKLMPNYLNNKLVITQLTQLIH